MTHIKRIKEFVNENVSKYYDSTQSLYAKRISFDRYSYDGKKWYDFNYEKLGTMEDFKKIAGGNTNLDITLKTDFFTHDITEPTKSEKVCSLFITLRVHFIDVASDDWEVSDESFYEVDPHGKRKPAILCEYINGVTEHLKSINEDDEFDFEYLEETIEDRLNEDKYYLDMDLKDCITEAVGKCNYAKMIEELKKTYVEELIWVAEYGEV